MAITGNLYKIETLLSKRNLDIVFEYLKSAANPESEVHKRIFSRPIGAFEKVPISDSIFALEQVFMTKDKASCFYESHQKYIDFQLNLAGIEQMEYIDIDKMIIKAPYDSKKDLITYEFNANTSKFVMEKNDISIYFPNDVHMGISMFNNHPELVYKTVVKFPLELYHV